MRYAKDVVRDVLEYRLATIGFGTQEWVPTPAGVRLQGGRRLLARPDAGDARAAPGRRGSSTSAAPAACSPSGPARPGHHVTGVDYMEIDGVRERTDRFFVGRPRTRASRPRRATAFDVVVAGDVIEHLSPPAELLRDIHGCFAPGGQLLLSVPNFGHWYPRIRVAAGLFGYDRRGILDDTHLRFFTRSTLRRTVRRPASTSSRSRPPACRWGRSQNRWPETSHRAPIDEALVRARPTLFGYQYVLRLIPHAQDSVHVEVI